jgi:ABC-type glycerol-3-phosphate transport system substrate-binding protein
MNLPKLLFAAAVIGLLPGCASKEEGLRFRYWGDNSEIAIISQTIKDFEAAHPGIKVRPERKPADANYANLLVSEFSAGVAPDVIFIGDLNCDKLIEAGKFIPLEGLCKPPHMLSQRMS